MKQLILVMVETVGQHWDGKIVIIRYQGLQ